MCEGISHELLGINLGDERLNKRSKRLLETLAANPQASVNGACDGWSDTLAAYRFFDNPSVTPEAILRPHLEATKQRMREQPVVLIVQDTTELDFTKHPPQDAECLNKSNRFGMYDHTHLAVTPQGLPLGVVGTEQFARAAESLGLADERSSLPIEEKESMRWLTGYRLACALAQECPGTQIVSVGDREADIYDIFVEAQQQTGVKAEFVIRSRVPRCTTERDVASGPDVYHKVRAEVAASELRGTRTITLCQTPKRAAREATLEIRALTVTVKPPHERPYLPTVTVNVVLVEEIGGPGDGTDVSWLLITSLPIGTYTEVLLIVDFYVARWTIEVYFRTLKSGCRVEEIQLETTARQQNCVAFYKIIAWRILYLTFLNRTSPELPCDVVFAASEWKSVWRVVTKKPLPPRPPLLSEFMRLVARLGGYNNRATEDPAGAQCIWIGVRRMIDFAAAWLAFGPERE